jgi:DNA-binding response OmpR family regulator
MTAPLLLIADDDADMRTLVRSTLRTDYPDALELVDGRELFWQLMRASVSQARPVVVIADIRMPAYTGLEVLDAWHGEHDTVPVVVITSFPDDDVRARVAQLGATLLPKPFTRARLREAVQDVQRKRRRAP